MAKKEVYKVGKLTEEKKNLINGLLQEYDIQDASDIQDALKDLLGGTIQEMLESEMDNFKELRTLRFLAPAFAYLLSLQTGICTNRVICSQYR